MGWFEMAWSSTMSTKLTPCVGANRVQGPVVDEAPVEHEDERTPEAACPAESGPPGSTSVRSGGVARALHVRVMGLRRGGEGQP